MEETPVISPAPVAPIVPEVPAPVKKDPALSAPADQKGGAAPEDDEPKTGFAAELFEFIWETLKVVIISLVIILPVRYYLIQPFFVQGSSMVPNFENHQYILVDKWTYKLGRPQRGDVVIFQYPGDPKEYYIKRIIGLPGETVLAGNNQIQIFNDRYPKGFVLDERGYLPAANPTYCGGNTTWCGTKVTLGATQYFMMGDNREHSSDSRFFGPVDYSFFAGMAWLRLWPVETTGFIPRTDYPPVVQ